MPAATPNAGPAKGELPPQPGGFEKKDSPGGAFESNLTAVVWRVRFRRTMKANIIITPKKAVVDPQGKTVRQALEQMGFHGIGAVHVGKYLEIELTGDRETARRQLDEACHKLLSNPLIEDYHFDLE